MPTRTLVIGDIHGALLALAQLLRRVDLQPTDRLIFLGDYVDGWSQSAEVIETLIALQNQQECIFLLGNHDSWCAEWLRNGTAPPVWLKSGGAGTIERFEKCRADCRQSALHFLDSLLPYYIDKDNQLFVHAGFTSMHGPAGEHHQSNFSWDRTLWETALSLKPSLPADHPRYPKRLKLFRQIFIGHTPTLSWKRFVPMHCANVWNVDTGAAFTGPLTALDVNTGAFWQSDPVFTLYPAEKGRN